MSVASNIAMRIAADYAHRDDYVDADDEERYANELAETIYDHFHGNRLESSLVDYVIKVSPKRYMKRDAKSDAQKMSYDVRVILMYVDEVEQSDIPCAEARRTWMNGSGGGEAFTNVDNLIVVVCGSSDDEWCNSEDYFKDTLSHELMHVLDHCAYNYAFNKADSYGKRTKHEEKRNLEVPYPVGNADILDGKYAEYFTCENEMREYRRDLRKEISDYCESTGWTWGEAIDEIRKSLSSEESCRRFIENWNGNVSPLAMLYHLCFSKTSHGNRQTALKLLEGLQPLD